MISTNITAFAKEQITKYLESFRVMTNAQVEAALLREKGCRGWTSQRSYYLAALREECERRNIPYTLE